MKQKNIKKRILTALLATGVIITSFSIPQTTSKAAENTIASSDNTNTQDATAQPDNSVTDGNQKEYSVIVQGSNPSIFNKSKVTTQYDNGYILSYDTKEKANRAEKLYANAFSATGSGDDEFEIADIQNDDSTSSASNEVEPISSSSGRKSTSENNAHTPTIALIDTGTPDGDKNVIKAHSVLKKEPETQDQNGHGSKMLQDITSMYPDAQVISVKAFDKDGKSTAIDVYAAIQYALQQNADIINLSFSGKTDNAAIEALLQDAINKGSKVVRAAGNKADDAANYLPGCIKDAYIIGTADSQGTYSTLNLYSNYGDTVDYYVNAESSSDAAAKFSAMTAKALSLNPEASEQDVKIANSDNVFTKEELYGYSETVQSMKDAAKENTQSDDSMQTSGSVSGSGGGAYSGSGHYQSKYVYWPSITYHDKNGNHITLYNVFILYQKNTNSSVGAVYGKNWQDQYARLHGYQSDTYPASTEGMGYKPRAHLSKGATYAGPKNWPGGAYSIYVEGNPDAFDQTPNAKAAGTTARGLWQSWGDAKCPEVPGAVGQGSFGAGAVFTHAPEIYDNIQLNEIAKTVAQPHRHIIQVQYQRVDGSWPDPNKYDRRYDGAWPNVAYYKVYDQSLYSGKTVSYPKWNPTSEFEAHAGISYTTGDKDETTYVSIPRRQYTYTFYENKPTNASKNVILQYIQEKHSRAFTKYAGAIDGAVNNPSLEGWTFIGWNTNSAGTGSWYNPNETMYSNKNFYAIWRANNYHVVYRTNSTQSNGKKSEGNFDDWGDWPGEYQYNVVTGSMPRSDYKYDTEGKLRGNTYGRKGYNWLGWRSASNGTGTDTNTIRVANTKNNSDRVYNWTAKNEDTINLDAQWQKRLGSVKLRLVSEETGNPMKDVQVSLRISGGNTGANINQQVATGKTDENGEVSFSGLHWFDYDIVSTNVPEGYEQIRTARFTVNQDNCDTTQQLYRVVYMKEHTLKVNATVPDIINSGKDYRTKEEGKTYKKEKAPSFVYHITGTDVAGVDHEYNLLANIDYNGNENQTTFAGSDTQKVFAGKYTVTEVPVSRYNEDGVFGVKNATYERSSKTGSLNAVNDDAEITYPHNIKEYGFLYSVKHAINQFVGGQTKGATNYAITYDLQGGSDPGNQASYSDKGGDVSLKQPTRDGYTFIGWTGSNGDKPQKDVVIKVSELVKNDELGDKHYVANWSQDTYSITYDLAGGKLPDGIANPNSYTTSTASFQLNNPVKDGYTFNGWSEDGESGSSTAMIVPQGSFGDKHFTAQWEPTVYTISYVYNGGDDPGNATTYTVETPDFSLNTPTRNGYSFTGWTGSNGTDPQKAVTIKRGTTGNLVYNANWNDAQYTITYLLNDSEATPASNNPDNPATYARSSNAIALKEPSRKGYSFTGWTKVSEDQTKESDTPDQNMYIEPDATGNKVFRAHWQPIEYSLTIDASPDDETEYKTSYTIEDESYTLPTPKSVDGFAFAGWGTTPDDDGSVQHEMSVTIPKGSTGDKEYYAYWTGDTYSIAYDYAGGDAINDNPTEYTHEFDTADENGDSDNTVITLKNPTRQGYAFIGWTDDSDQTKEPKPDSEAKIDYSFYASDIGSKYFVAHWRKHTVTRQVRYQNADGSWGDYKPFNSQEYDYGDPVDYVISVDYGDQVPAIKIPETSIYQAAEFPAFTMGDGDVTQRIDVYRKTYTVTWNGNENNADGSDQIETEEFYVGQSGTLALSKYFADTPSNANQQKVATPIFDGWYTDKAGGTQISADTKLPGINTTYYAHWKN